MEMKKLFMILSIIAILVLVGCKEKNMPIAPEEPVDEPETVADIEETLQEEEDLTAKDILKGGATLEEEEPSEGTGVLAVLDNTEATRTSTWTQYGYYGEEHTDERSIDEDESRKAKFRRTLKNADVPGDSEAGSD
ncbi:hypothetical protein J4410_01835 [Candidatus Woesearchaeota archaeon]|nr:hypothetical protein [Candidatus Woesearchaeota archaeon]